MELVLPSFHDIFTPPPNKFNVIPNRPPSSLKSKAPFQEMIPRKKIGNIINTCVLLIKQHWEKMTEIPQKRDYPTWSIQNFVKKVKQFAKKYYITSLTDLANKLYGAEEFLNFILCPVLLNIASFFLRNFSNRRVK